MPAPWLPLTLAEFRTRVGAFDWRRQIDAVHMHHTYSPDHRSWIGGPRGIQAMADFHVRENGWSDLAQHVTIAPDGVIWTGRDWNRPPASSSGAHGTSARGPFMFETVGNFDVGHDALTGTQRQSVLGVIAAVQDHFGLAVESLRFHRMLGSPKTCPGTSLDYATVCAEVRGFRFGHRAACSPSTPPVIP